MSPPRAAGSSEISEDARAQCGDVSIHSAGVSEPALLWLTLALAQHSSSPRNDRPLCAFHGPCRSIFSSLFRMSPTLHSAPALGRLPRTPRSVR